MVAGVLTSDGFSVEIVLLMGNLFSAVSAFMIHTAMFSSMHAKVFQVYSTKWRSFSVHTVFHSTGRSTEVRLLDVIARPGYLGEGYVVPKTSSLKKTSDSNFEFLRNRFT